VQNFDGTASFTSNFGGVGLLGGRASNNHSDSSFFRFFLCEDFSTGHSTRGDESPLGAGVDIAVHPFPKEDAFEGLPTTGGGGCFGLCFHL